MILYSWTALSGSTSDAVVGLGISRDHERARLDAEEALLSGRAFVAMIEALGAVSASHGLYPCYLHTGEAWLGRRNKSGGVVWRTYFSRRSLPCDSCSDLLVRGL
jgi:hypothetical protein